MKRLFQNLYKKSNTQVGRVPHTNLNTDLAKRNPNQDTLKIDQSRRRNEKKEYTEKSKHTKILSKIVPFCAETWQESKQKNHKYTHKHRWKVRNCRSPRLTRGTQFPRRRRRRCHCVAFY